MKRIRMLLVDDQELIRESLAFVLNTDEDIDVVGLAGNGEEALRLCEAERPSIVLMDIQMPIMNGIEATRGIKARWPETKVIILTTFQEVDQVMEALTIGAEGYLLKAIHPKELISGIKHVFHAGTLLSQELAKALVLQARQAKTLAPSPSPSPSPSDEKTGGKERYGLTEREEQILQYLAQGLSNRQISERLFLSEGTVKNYISSVYHKLDVKDRTQAALKAKDADLV
ncbi:response regulator transcription factor [Paenibacillus sp. TRM 82003]|nr:response regulator transcription factor [Paenibacillus sp. TRM 82003]